jgi:maltose-binding protein MalE
MLPRISRAGFYALCGRSRLFDQSRHPAASAAGVLPKSVSYSTVDELMGQGKLAMMISGPSAWPNLIKNGIDFGVAPIPGVDQNIGRPFVGVTVAYLNRSSPNHLKIVESSTELRMSF